MLKHFFFFWLSGICSQKFFITPSHQSRTAAPIQSVLLLLLLLLHVSKNPCTFLCSCRLAKRNDIGTSVNLPMEGGYYVILFYYTE